MTKGLHTSLGTEMGGRASCTCRTSRRSVLGMRSTICWSFPVLCRDWRKKRLTRLRTSLETWLRVRYVSTPSSLKRYSSSFACSRRMRDVKLADM